MKLGRPKSASSKQQFFPVSINMLPSQWTEFKIVTQNLCTNRSALIRKWIKQYIQEHQGDKSNG